METSAPHTVAGPDVGLEENQVVPENPGDVVQGQGGKHVTVHCDSQTFDGGEREEDGEREQETNQRNPEEHQRQSVDGEVKVGVLKVQARIVVSPTPATSKCFHSEQKVKTNLLVSG